MTVAVPADMLDSSAGKAHTWIWRGQSVHYVHQGSLDPQGFPEASAPAILLIHGFGASVGHWRHNMPALAAHYNVFALDLLGFGRSAKPNWEYRTDIWRDQVRDFCQQVIRRPAVLVGNSLGGYVALSMAADYGDWAKGIVLLNSAGSFGASASPSSQPHWQSQLIWSVLRQPLCSFLLFQYMRQPTVIRKTLQKLYVNQEAITEDLVEMIRRPSDDPGAAAVFMALLQGQQQGRTVDELLRSLVRPILLLWGERDPWMNVRQRSQLYHTHYVHMTEYFLNAGHCPQDDTPDEVNRLIQQWIDQTWRQETAA